jgi:hypothetical protein
MALDGQKEGARDGERCRTEPPQGFRNTHAWATKRRERDPVLSI